MLLNNVSSSRKIGIQIMETMFQDDKYPGIFNSSRRVNNNNVVTSEFCQIRDSDNFWSVVSIMIHDKHIDKQSKLKVYCCALRTSNYEDDDGSIYNTWPLFILELTYQELIENMPFLYSSEARAKGYVNRQETVKLHTEYLSMLFIPESRVESHYARFAEDILLKAMKNLEIAFAQTPIKFMNTVCEYYQNKPIYYRDLIILMRIYAFTTIPSHQKDVYDSLGLTIIKLQNFRKNVIPLDNENQQKKVTGFIKFNNKMHYQQFVRNMTSEIMNDNYDEFWEFIRYQNWTRFMYAFLQKEKHKVYNQSIAELKWLGFDTYGVIIGMLKEGHISVDDSVGLQYIPTYGDRKIMEANICTGLQTISSEILPAFHLRVTTVTNKYNILNNFRQEIGFAVTNNQCDILNSKLRRYFPGLFMAEQNHLKGIKRKDVKHLSKKQSFQIIERNWFENKRDLFDEPKPVIEVYSSIQFNNKYQSQKYGNILYKPFIMKQVNGHTFDECIIRDSSFFIDTPLYADIKTKLIKAADDNMLQATKGLCFGLSEKTNGTFCPEEVCSYVYQDYLEDLLADHQDVIDVETAGVCVHTKVDKSLSVFNALFDIDLDMTTEKNCIRYYEIFRLGLNIYSSFCNMFKLLQLIADGTEFCNYVDFKTLEYKDSESIKVYMYYSVNKLLEQKIVHKSTKMKRIIWPHNVDKDGKQFSGMETTIMDALNEMIPTKSLRIFVEFPPNVMFIDASTFNQYIQYLEMFMDQKLILGLTTRLCRNGKLFDLQVNQGMCRMPLSPKHNGEEKFLFLPLVTNPSQIGSTRFLQEDVILACLDKNKGFIHRDNYPQNVNSPGMLIQCLKNSYIDRHYSNSLIYHIDDEERRQIELDIKKKINIKYDDNIESIILEKLKTGLKNVGFPPLDKKNKRSLNEILHFLQGVTLMESTRDELRVKNGLLLTLVDSKMKHKFDNCLIVKHRKVTKNICQACVLVNHSLQVKLFYHCFNCMLGSGSYELVFTFCL